MVAVAIPHRRSRTSGQDVPRWITLRRKPAICTRCGRLICVEKLAFLVPRLGLFYCGRMECGAVVERRLRGEIPSPIQR
jgi:hypothetical protein